MDSKQHLYYAIGIMAYAVAKADGEIQDEEKDKLISLVKEKTNTTIDYQYTSIIFQILEGDGESSDGVYNWAIEALKTGKHYITKELKENIKSLLEAVANAFPPTTKEESDVKNKFIEALDEIGNVNLPLS